MTRKSIGHDDLYAALEGQTNANFESVYQAGRALDSLFECDSAVLPDAEKIRSAYWYFVDKLGSSLLRVQEDSCVSVISPLKPSIEAYVIGANLEEDLMNNAYQRAREELRTVFFDEGLERLAFARNLAKHAGIDNSSQEQNIVSYFYERALANVKSGSIRAGNLFRERAREVAEASRVDTSQFEAEF